MDFSKRMMDASRVCRNEFQPSKLVNSYVREIHEATPEKFQEHISIITLKERNNMVPISQL